MKSWWPLCSFLATVSLDTDVILSVCLLVCICIHARACAHSAQHFQCFWFIFWNHWYSVVCPCCWLQALGASHFILSRKMTMVRNRAFARLQWATYHHPVAYLHLVLPLFSMLRDPMDSTSFQVTRPRFRLLSANKALMRVFSSLLFVQIIQMFKLLVLFAPNLKAILNIYWLNREN